LLLPATHCPTTMSEVLDNQTEEDVPSDKFKSLRLHSLDDASPSSSCSTLESPHSRQEVSPQGKSLKSFSSPTHSRSNYQGQSSSSSPRRGQAEDPPPNNVPPRSSSSSSTDGERSSSPPTPANNKEKERLASPRSATAKEREWKLKALTGKGIVRGDGGELGENATTTTTRVKLPTHEKEKEKEKEREEKKNDIQKAKSPRLRSSAASPSHDLEPAAASKRRNIGKKSLKQDKRASREDKTSKKSKTLQHQSVADVSLPKVVVKRVHVDKDSLAQDMDGVLRTLRDEIERLNRPSEPQKPVVKRHRRSKSIDQLDTQNDIIVPATSAAQEPERPPQGRPVAHKSPGGERTKTNTLRQQLLLGKGVAKPEDKRTVPVSRLSVLIDLADIQDMSPSAAIIRDSPSRPLKLSLGGRSKAEALKRNEAQQTTQELLRQRLKTVKAVVAAAFDEIQYELQRQRSSALDEGQLIVLGTKLNQLNNTLQS